VRHFSHPDAVKALSIAKTLDISRTKVMSMVGCCALPRLTVFIADRTKIAHFANFRVLRSVITFSLRGTPVSKTPTYRLSLLLAVGTKSIISIDGSQISRNLISQLRNYPPECRGLANRGWLAAEQPPSPEELRSLCAEYVINEPVLRSDPEELVSFVRDADGGGFGRLREEHKGVLRRGQAQFGLVGDAADGNSERLIADIAEVLSRHGIDGEIETADAVFNTVERLCRETHRSKTPM
jgi:hypothetical protein